MVKSNRGLGQEVNGYRLVFGYLGAVLIMIGMIVMLPLIVLVAFPEEIHQAKYFIIPGVCSILAGYLLMLLIRNQPKGNLKRHQDTMIVVFSWILAIVICAIPFVMTGQYNFTQAVFECTSGWSTTGLSIVNVDITPKIFLMHRSIMLFFGGIGLVLVMLSVLSDSYGMRLYTAEGHSDKLLPNLLRSSRVIIAIYAGYILGGMVLYMFFGMNWFDALNHSIAALSTGGFSTHSENIGYFDSFPIELVSVVLMLLGCTNFLAHLYLIKGKIRNFFNYCEVKFMLFIVAFMTPIFFVLLLVGKLSDSVPRAFRDALFQVVSALSTTGFQNVDTFADWTPALIVLMTLLHLIGGGTGSTAGGMKQYRVYTMLKDVWESFRSHFESRRIVRTRKMTRPDGDEYLSSSSRNEIATFIMLYFVVFILGTFVLTCYGYSIGDSLFEFSSALGTVGLSAGITSYDAPSGVLWVETIGMFIGRLEIYAVLLVIIRMAKDVRMSGKRIKQHLIKRGRQR